MAQRESKMVRNSLTDIAPNNSNKAARGEVTESKGPAAKDRPKLKAVVSKGSVAKKKRTVMDKFKESFLGESENLGDYVIYDVLVPAFRDTISDMGFGVIERLFGNGRSKSRSNITRDRGRSYVTYNDNRRGDTGRGAGRDLDRNARARHDFENVIFTYKWEAEDVLSHMARLVVEYGAVTVRDFYELSDIDADYTDEKYGWTDLREAYVDRSRNGFIILFPSTRLL